MALAAALALVAGCSAIDALSDLDGELASEGFGDVSTSVSPTNASHVLVSASAPRGSSVEEAQDQAAEVVWTRFPRRFEHLRVTIDGERRQWTYAELEDELGDRPASLDVSTEIGDEWTRMSVIAVLGLLAAAVVGLGIVGLIVFLAVRANRRKAPTRRPLQPWMPPGHPAGPGGMQGPGPVGSPVGPVPPMGGWAPASAPPGPPRPPGAPPTADPTATVAGQASSPPADPTPTPTTVAGQAPSPTADAPGSPAPSQGDPTTTGDPTAATPGPSLAKPPTAGPDAPAPSPSPSHAPTPAPWAPPPPAQGWTPGAAPPPGPGPIPDAPPVAGPRAKDPDARRLGRRPRGPVPDKAHTPPGWG